MDFFIEVLYERSDTTCHDVHDWVLNMILLNMFTADFKSYAIVINCLNWPNLRNLDFKAMGIVKLKLMVINLLYTLNFALIHASIAICFAGNMILNILFILMILCELINKCLIATISSKAFRPDKVYMLHFSFSPSYLLLLYFLCSAWPTKLYPIEWAMALVRQHRHPRFMDSPQGAPYPNSGQLGICETPSRGH